LANLQQAVAIARSLGIPPYETGISQWIRDVLTAIRDQNGQAEYQRQCQQTAATTDLPITEWCP